MSTASASGSLRRHPEGLALPGWLLANDAGGAPDARAHCAPTDGAKVVDHFGQHSELLERVKRGGRPRWVDALVEHDADKRSGHPLSEARRVGDIGDGCVSHQPSDG